MTPTATEKLNQGIAKLMADYHSSILSENIKKGLKAKKDARKRKLQCKEK